MVLLRDLVTIVVVDMGGLRISFRENGGRFWKSMPF